MSKHRGSTLQDEQLARNDEIWGRIGVGFIAVAAVVELVRGAVGSCCKAKTRVAQGHEVCWLASGTGC